MTDQYISQIQNRVITLLRSYEIETSKSLNLLVEDACSEVSRLVACWILNDYPSVKTSIAKGKNVQNKNEFCHDILLVEDNNQIIIIDPTIWQIFPNKESIFVDNINSLESALSLLEKQYLGTWKISETISLNEYSPKEQEELKRIIKGIVQYKE